jgi:diadenosine tetraphosphate (Ap4A) HIT family hydrolase
MRRKGLMSSDREDCFYCAKDERLYRLMIEICKLETSTLFLFREQTYRGRCVVALNAHETELFRLDRETLCAFSRDVAKTAAALQRAFGAAKINYAIYGDLVSHLHYHVVPKHQNGHNWGEPFAVHASPAKYLSEEGYREVTTTIREHLSE